MPSNTLRGRQRVYPGMHPSHAPNKPRNLTTPSNTRPRSYSMSGKGSAGQYPDTQTPRMPTPAPEPTGVQNTPLTPRSGQWVCNSPATMPFKQWRAAVSCTLQPSAAGLLCVSGRWHLITGESGLACVRRHERQRESGTRPRVLRLDGQVGCSAPWGVR